MNNQRVPIILLALLVLFSGCLNLDESIYKEDVGYKEEAIKKENLSICSKVKRHDIRDQCYSEIYDKFKDRAINTKNITWCYKIEIDRAYYTSPYSEKRVECMAEIGVLSNNISICTLMNRYHKNECYKKIAIAKKDIKICEYCEDNVESNDFKSDCLFELFKELDLRDPSICERIVDNFSKSVCLAIIRGHEICGNMSSTESKDGCYMELAKVQKDFDLCEKLSNRYARYGTGECYIQIAKAKKDFSVCEKITGTKSKDDCYMELAKVNEDPSVCEKRSDRDKFKIEECKYEILNQIQMSEIHEIEICSNMTISRWKDLCYKKVASKLNKAELCERIGDINNRDYCFLDIAKKEKDVYVCNGLGSLDKKLECYLSVCLHSSLNQPS